MNLEEIKFNYSQMDTDKLIKLVSEIEDLRVEVIPLLKDELKKRNEENAILKINRYNEGEKEEQKFEDKVNIDKYVNERLASGEMMESIADDLKEKGVDLLARAIDSSLEDENLTEEIYNMKSTGFSDKEIEEKLKEEYLIDREKIESLKSRIVTKSKNNLITGVLSILGGLFLLIIGLSAGKLKFLSIGLIILGVSKIILSYNQKKVD